MYKLPPLLHVLPHIESVYSEKEKAVREEERNNVRVRLTCLISL